MRGGESARCSTVARCLRARPCLRALCVRALTCRVVAELERYFGRISASSVYAPAVPCEDVRRSFSPTGRMNAEQLEKLWVRIEAQVEATSNFARTQSFLGAGGACMCWVPRRGAHADMITK